MSATITVIKRQRPLIHRHDYAGQIKALERRLEKLQREQDYLIHELEKLDLPETNELLEYVG